MVDDKKLVPSIGHVFLSRQTLYVFQVMARLRIVRPRRGGVPVALSQ